MSKYSALLNHPAVKKAKASPKKPPVRFIMCPPKYLSTAIPNNVFMDKKEPVDVPRALAQYARFKNAVMALGVDVLEIPATEGCQDQTFVANIGISIEPYIVLANYKAPGRACEVPPARKFFETLGYECIQPPFHFEGYADLKPWKDGIYFGGVGQFTDQRALDWIAKKTGVRIISLNETNAKAYHLDCNLIFLNEKAAIVNPAGLDRQSIAKLEQVVEVIQQPKGLETTGITNGVMIPGQPIYCSGTFNPEQPDYRKAMEWLLETMDKFGVSVFLMDTDAVDVSGADLSCTVMPLTF